MFFFVVYDLSHGKDVLGILRGRGLLRVTVRLGMLVRLGQRQRQRFPPRPGNLRIPLLGR